MDILGFDKIVYHYDKLEKLRRGEPQLPVHVTVSLGNYCNHKCLWCTAYAAQQKQVRQMDGDRLVRFLERAAARGLKAVGYVGNGEPTAYPGFRELTRRVNALGLEQGMFTNGYLLDRVMDEVLECFTYVRVSLDAGSAAMHASMHDVANHFDRIMANLGTIIARRRNAMPTVGIQYAVHHRNVDDLYTAARLAREIGVDYFSIKPVFNRGSVGERIEKNELTSERLAPIAARIRHDLEAPDFAVHYRSFQIMSEQADHNILEYGRCVAGLFNLNVMEDGRLVSCGPHQIAVGTMEDDLDTVAGRIMETMEALDLSKCPGGCRYHALNHLVDTVVSPGKARRYHHNFL